MEAGGSEGVRMKSSHPGARPRRGLWGSGRAGVIVGPSSCKQRVWVKAKNVGTKNFPHGASNRNAMEIESTFRSRKLKKSRFEFKLHDE